MTTHELINKHPNYSLIFLDENSLREELKGWSREGLISWLMWNDPNGIYSDNESLTEIGNILTYDEAIEIIVNQVIQV